MNIMAMQYGKFKEVTDDMVSTKIDFRIVFLVTLCLIIAVIIPYQQVINFDFVGYDDELYVTKNLNVQKGFTAKGVKWAFTSFHSANWHPVTWLSHMLDIELYGLNPMGHHWTNLQFHIANTLLLFFILFKMTGALWRSAFVAALFALHPLHVESVAWVSERKDVLSAFFGLLSIAAYCRYVKNPQLINYLLIVLLLGLGLMAKPMLVTLPFVLLLLDYWPLQRIKFQKNLNAELVESFGFKAVLRLIWEKIPLFTLVAVASTLTFIAQQSEGAVKALGVLSLKIRVANALVSYVNYALKVIWPSNLAVFYPHPGNSLPAWQIVGAALLIAVAIFLSIRTSKKYPYIAVGLFWYLGTLVPVIGLVQVGNQAMADRYTYIPLIGLFIIVSWGVFDFLKKWHYHTIILIPSAISVIFVLAVCAFLQLGYWQNGITLFEHAIKVTNKNCVAHNNLGVLLSEEEKFDEAVFHCDEVLKIKPNDSRALYNKGCALRDKRDLDKAAFFFKESLKINPDYAEAHNGLAYILFVQGKPDEAILHYRNALKIKPDFTNVYNNLANVLYLQGEIDKAVLLYKEALRLEPENVDAHYNIGLFYKRQGKLKKAMTHLAKAIKIDPDYAKAYNEIGVILFQQGKYKKAEVFFLKAVQIRPNYTEARKNIAILEKNLSSQ
jgi:tetratricopeptide (TPR) repeat protein